MPLLVQPQVPYVEEARIALDGDAHDAAWVHASALPAMTMFAPTPGADPTGHTDARVLASRSHLYLLFEVHDPEPDRVRAALGRRDTRFADDFVGVYLDPAGAGERAYLLLANPLGVQMDGVRTADGSDDISWDGQWEARGVRTDDGYVVEMAIPWSTLRHPPAVTDVGLLTLRQVGRTAEKSSWPAIDPKVQGVLEQQAVIPGPGELPAAGGVDVLPSLTFGWTEDGPVDRTLSVEGFSPGGTVRWRPSPDAAVLATVNPDFSQVESDAAQVGVNRRFALSFQEKRPFFLDGSEWFSHPFGALLYTRSMVSPLGGARATVEGRGWTTAALSVLDETPAPSVSEGGGWSADDLEGHSALATVARTSAEVGGGRVGLLASDKTVLGTDLANRLLAVDGRAPVGTSTVARGAVLASHTTFADAEEALAPAASASIQGDSGTVFAGARGEWIAPGFRAENGFVVSADRVGGNGWAGVTARPGGAVSQVWLTPLSLGTAWRTAGTLREVATDPNVRVQLGNGAVVAGGAELGGEEFTGAWLPTRTGWGGVGGSWTRWLEASAEVRGGVAPNYDPTDPRPGQLWSGGGAVTLRPVPAVGLTGTLGAERMTEDAGLVYAGAVARVRAELFLSKRLWLRSIADLSTFEERRGAEVLGAWEVGPGQGVYLGGRVGESTADGASYSAFSKVAWTL